MRCRSISSFFKGAKDLQMHKRRLLKSYVCPKNENSFAKKKKNCWANQRAKEALDRFAGLCGLGKFWDLLLQDSGMQVSKKGNYYVMNQGP